MARRYDMQKRARAAEDTRGRIIEAAHALLNRQDGNTLTLNDVAAVAAVTRPTIYNSIGSRPELLAAVFEDQGRLIEFERVLAATRLPDARRALVATVRESCRAWTVMPDAIRKTLALAVIDPEVGALVQRYEQYRRAEMAALARRAHQAGVLDPRVSAKSAATTMALLTGFPAFDQLRHAMGTRGAASHLVHMVKSLIVHRSDPD
jgi:AcrR family transcriptional regulator